MTHQNNRSFEFTEAITERFQCFNVEIVGRLIHNQNMGLFQHELGQYYPAQFTAG